jgi:hypothetical protein
VNAPTPAGKPCWRTLFLEVRSGLFFPRLVVWDPQTGEFTCVEGPKGFATWEEADQAGKFLSATPQP